jgi:hypothetical protein
MNENGQIIGRLLLAICCAMNYGCQSNRGRSETPEPSVRASAIQQEKRDEFNIKSIEFFAWRGEDPKRTYVKIDTLDAKDATRAINPERFDVILQVENKSRSSIQNGDLILLTTMEFVVASGDPSKTNAQEVISETSWSRDLIVDDVKMALVPFLEAGKQGQLEFTGFDLANQNKVLRDTEIISHIWAIKVTVHVLDRKMTKIMQRDAIITIPS